MKPKPHVDYDEEADVLYITFGLGELSYGDLADGFLLIERGIDSNAITGCQLIGLKQWLQKQEEKIRKAKK